MKYYYKLKRINKMIDEASEYASLNNINLKEIINVIVTLVIIVFLLGMFM